jgi:hypothetical protein
MSGYFIGTSIVINDDAAYIHESFSTVGAVGVGTTEMTPSDAAAGDQFGTSVAVGSGRIVVGALFNDDSGSNSGSAYIFDLDGNEVGIITASDGAADDEFGTTVAVGSGRIVVGAPFDDDNANASGSAYIFDLDGNQLSKITASDFAANDRFGTSVAVGCGRIVVGANLDDDKASSSGSAYIFDLDGNQLTKITASDGAFDDRFGTSVAVGSGRIVVGAPLNNDNGSNSGSAYIFDLNGNQLSKITASDAAGGDQFGISVAAGSGRIVVGAWGDNSFRGSAYIFDLDGNQLGKIVPATVQGNDINFGRSVAVGSGKIVIGAEKSYYLLLYTLTGKAYIYDLDGSNEIMLDPPNPASNIQFGNSVAVGCGKVVVGSDGDDTNGTDSGSAYIFNLSEDSNTYWERILETYKY